MCMTIVCVSIATACHKTHPNADTVAHAQASICWQLLRAADIELALMAPMR